MKREQFLKLLGTPPLKASLNTKIIEEVDCGCFVRKKVSFSSEPEEKIFAYLCVPKIDSPMPAVYCFHQHAGNHLLGKSEVVGLDGSLDQHYAKELAEKGFVTIAVDAICFEQRAYTKDPFKYHVHQLNTRLVQGQTLLGKILFDVSSGIDLLQSLPEVDSSNIGFIGHSYGGRTALFAPAYDRRIKASVSSCGSTNYKDMIAHNTGVQLDFVIPNILEHGDLEDVIKLVEPASLLIVGTDDDKWSLSIDYISKYSSEAFKQGMLKTAIFKGKHQFSDEMRSLAYEFLDKNLRANLQ